MQALYFESNPLLNRHDIPITTVRQKSVGGAAIAVKRRNVWISTDGIF